MLFQPSVGVCVWEMSKKTTMEMTECLCLLRAEVFFQSLVCFICCLPCKFSKDANGLGIKIETGGGPFLFVLKNKVKVLIEYIVGHCNA